MTPVGSETAWIKQASKIISQEVNPVRAGTGVFLLSVKEVRGKKRLQIWLGKRKGAHGAGEWALPGGKPELYEDLQVAGAREVLEETGCKVNGIMEPLTWTNDIYKSHDLHYVTLYFVAMNYTGTPRVVERNKCSGWKQFDAAKLPKPTMAGLREAVGVLLRRYNHLLDA